MKKALIILAIFPFFLVACTDKKAEAKKVKDAEVKLQIENVEKEIENVIDDVEKEANEIENALKELDNL